MLKPFTQSLRIEVAPQALRLLRVRRWHGGAAELLAEQAMPQAQDGASLAGALDALLAAQDMAGQGVCLVLDDALVRLWLVNPPPQAARLADLEAAAALRFHALFGEAPAAWEISADWDAAQPFLAAAVPRALKAQLEQAALQRKLVVTGMLPHFVAAWNRHARSLKAGAWFGAVQDKVLALAAIEDGQLRAVRHVPLAQGADHYWLTQMAQREALLLDLTPPALIQLCGELPPQLAKPAASDSHIATALLGAAA